MGQMAFEIQTETCMSYMYLPFPQGIRYFCMPYCIVFLGVIEKSCQKLVLRVSSGFQTPRNNKSSVSRCLEPLMKHESRVFNMISQSRLEIQCNKACKNNVFSAGIR